MSETKRINNKIQRSVEKIPGKIPFDLPHLQKVSHIDGVVQEVTGFKRWTSKQKKQYSDSLFLT